MNKPMPAIFLGHGNPMNALQHNGYTERWAAIGKDIPRPQAILAVSAHWYVPGTAVTATAAPRTIHDFGGFPRELHEFTYAAPGAPALANRVKELLARVEVELDQNRGIDHGVWSVLCHVFPDADIPVVQLSINASQPSSYHFEVGRQLGVLRDEGVLIIGSGNVVHNLHTYAWGESAEPFDWALRFETRVRELLLAGDDELLIDYEVLGSDAVSSVPDREHYFPLLYVIATRRQHERVSFPVSGIEGGSVSMLAVRIG